MYVAAGSVRISAGDLATYAACPFDVLRRLDIHCGRVAVEPAAVPAIRQRVMELGREHEAAILEQLRRAHGEHQPGVAGGVVALGAALRPDQWRPAAEHLLAVLDEQPDVVHQAPLSAGPLYGLADVLRRTPEGWQLVEIKLAHRVKQQAAIQAGAYLWMLRELGVRTHPQALFHLGTGAIEPVNADELVEQALTVLDECVPVLSQHLASGRPCTWGDDAIASCGWCETCQSEALLHRDVRLVAGLRSHERDALRQANIRTIDELATLATDIDVEQLEPERLIVLRSQALLQAQQRPPGWEHDPSLERPVSFEVYSTRMLDRLPAPCDGDVFLDFESDPMWRTGELMGLEYLCGMWLPDRTDPYLSLWAHSLEQESQLLSDFVEIIQQRLARHPDLRVYHFASYETQALLKLATRHHRHADVLEYWIEEGLFVDLLPVVKGSVRISQDGYGLKKIEPIYMGSDQRDGAVVDAAASVVGYSLYAQQVRDGDPGAAAQSLAALADYNRYDCLSTMRLRDWLLSLRGQ